MRVYVAAPWTAKDAAQAAAGLLEDAGHKITKKWWEHREVPGYLAGHADDRELQDQASEDIAGINSASAFVLLNLSKSEGKAVETGYALAAGCQMILVGDPSNLFHYLPEWTRVPSIESAVAVLTP